jgi:hypothetical protein
MEQRAQGIELRAWCMVHRAEGKWKSECGRWKWRQKAEFSVGVD